jgi:hypothetical protein
MMKGGKGSGRTWGERGPEERGRQTPIPAQGRMWPMPKRVAARMPTECTEAAVPDSAIYLSESGSGASVPESGLGILHGEGKSCRCGWTIFPDRSRDSGRCSGEVRVADFTAFLQIGQRILTERLRGIGLAIVEGRLQIADRKSAVDQTIFATRS